MTDYVVANCETSEYNGTYTWGGELDPYNWYLFSGEDLIAGLNCGDPYAFGTNLASVDGAMYYDYNYDDAITEPDDPAIVWWSSDTDTASALTVTAAGGSSQNLTLTCAAGSYSLTGTNATLTTTGKQNLTLACNAGTYSLTGTNADLSVNRHYTLTCEAGSYSLTGTNADFYRALVMACNAGSYALTGSDATFKRGYYLSAEAGAFVLSGTDVTLSAIIAVLGSVAILPSPFAVGITGRRVSIKPTNGRLV